VSKRAACNNKMKITVLTSVFCLLIAVSLL